MSDRDDLSSSRSPTGATHLPMHFLPTACENASYDWRATRRQRTTDAPAGRQRERAGRFDAPHLPDRVCSGSVVDRSIPRRLLAFYGH
jgi:hypothetical protein